MSQKNIPSILVVFASCVFELGRNVHCEESTVSPTWGCNFLWLCAGYGGDIPSGHCNSAAELGWTALSRHGRDHPGWLSFIQFTYFLDRYCIYLGSHWGVRMVNCYRTAYSSHMSHCFSDTALHCVAVHCICQWTFGPAVRHAAIPVSCIRSFPIPPSSWAAIYFLFTVHQVLAWWHWTSDPELTASVPGSSSVTQQVVYTCFCLPSSINWYWPRVMMF